MSFQKEPLSIGTYRVEGMMFMAGRNESSKIRPFPDTCVIYYSRGDSCWIAHSLRSDQIGTGESIVEALANLLRAVDHLLTLAESDDTLKILSAAPQSVKLKARSAQKLPNEVYEIAYKMIHGKWPKQLEPEFKAPQNHPFVANIRKEVFA